MEKGRLTQILRPLPCRFVEKKKSSSSDQWVWVVVWGLETAKITLWASTILTGQGQISDLLRSPKKELTFFARRGGNFTLSSSETDMLPAYLRLTYRLFCVWLFVVFVTWGCGLAARRTTLWVCFGLLSSCSKVISNESDLPSMGPCPCVPLESWGPSLLVPFAQIF